MPTVHQTTDTRMANPAHHNCNDATNGTSVTSPTTPAAACPPALQLPQPCATGPHQHNARASTAGSHCPNIQPQHGTRQPAGGQQQAFNCDMQDWMGHKVCSAHTASWLGEPAASPLAVCTVLSSAPPPKHCQFPGVSCNPELASHMPRAHSIRVCASRWVGQQ